MSNSIEDRLKRIETRLCKLMIHHGVETHYDNVTVRYAGSSVAIIDIPSTQIHLQALLEATERAGLEPGDSVVLKLDDNHVGELIL